MDQMSLQDCITFCLSTLNTDYRQDSPSRQSENQQYCLPAPMSPMNMGHMPNVGLPDNDYMQEMMRLLDCCPHTQPALTGVSSSLQMTNYSLPQLQKKVDSNSFVEPKKLLKDKKMHRLEKNREAARVARQRKHNYIRGLERREIELQKVNESLLEEIQAIKKQHHHQDY